MFRVRGKRKTTGNGQHPGGLSIWDPVHLGVDERGQLVWVRLSERNLITAGEPGAGKSVALNLIVAHAALSLDCRLILGHGWANQGYTAADIDPTCRGVGWLIAEGGIPRRMKTAYLTDEQAAVIAEHAAQLRDRAALAAATAEESESEEMA